MRQSRTSIQPELLLPLDRGSGRALRSQLEDRLRTAIRAGTLGPGGQLPSTRVLAHDLGLSRGLAEARDALAGYLGRVRAVAAEPARVIICTGCAQGLRLLCAVLRNRGVTRLALEEPTHPGQRHLIARAGLEPVPIAVDEDGL